MKLEIEIRSFEKKGKPIQSERSIFLKNGILLIFLLLLIGVFLPFSSPIKIGYEIVVGIGFIVVGILYFLTVQNERKEIRRMKLLNKKLKEIEKIIKDLEENHKEVLDIAFSKEEVKSFQQELTDSHSITSVIQNKVFQKGEK